MANVQDHSQSTRDQLDRVNIEMEQLKNKVAVQEKLVSILQEGLDDTQGRMRWNTVIIHGIPGSREEGSWSECKKLVAKLLMEHLDMPSAVEDIERAHQFPVDTSSREKNTKINICGLLEVEDCQ